MAIISITCLIICSQNFRPAQSSAYMFNNWGGKKCTNKDVCNFIAREYFIAGYKG